VVYNELAEAGHFHDQRVELIRGRIIKMPAMGPDHITSRRKAEYRLRDHFQEKDGYVVEGQVPLRLTDSEPEPDVYVFRGTLDDEAGGENEVLLVVEAAKTSLTFDRGEKLSLYAENGFGDYWILNLVDHVLEVYRNPIEINGTWTYADKTTIPADGTVSPLAKPEAVLKVADLLPQP
jgi:Uma2 family endonuclease